MRKLASLLGIVLSAVVILMGILILAGAVLDYDGEWASYTTFGADFYTYSYRATRYAANNVRELGEFAQGALGLVMMFAGAAGALLSLYGLGAAQESERKQALLQAILQKQGTAAAPCQTAPETPAVEETPVVEEQAE